MEMPHSTKMSIQPLITHRLAPCETGRRVASETHTSSGCIDPEPTPRLSPRIEAILLVDKTVVDPVSRSSSCRTVPFSCTELKLQIAMRCIQ